MEMINDIIPGGKAPEFSKVEIERIKTLESTETYWQDAYRFLVAFLSKEMPWEMMTKKQRMWLWKIKDDVENTIKRDGQ